MRKLPIARLPQVPLREVWPCKETAKLTERITALEREIDERVAGLYGVDELPAILAEVKMELPT